MKKFLSLLVAVTLIATMFVFAPVASADSNDPIVYLDFSDSSTYTALDNANKFSDNIATYNNKSAWTAGLRKTLKLNADGSSSTAPGGVDPTKTNYIVVNWMIDNPTSVSLSGSKQLTFVWWSGDYHWNNNSYGIMLNNERLNAMSTDYVTDIIALNPQDNSGTAEKEFGWWTVDSYPDLSFKIAKIAIYDNLDAANAAVYGASDDGTKDGITPFEYINYQDIASFTNSATTAAAVKFEEKDVIKITKAGQYFDFNIAVNGITETKDYFVKIKFKVDSEATTQTPKDSLDFKFDLGVNGGFSGGWGYGLPHVDGYMESAKTEWKTVVAKVPGKSISTFYTTWSAMSAGSIYVEYIAFFDNEADMEAYDRPVAPTVTAGSYAAVTDRDSNTVTFNVGALKSIDDLKAILIELDEKFEVSGEPVSGTDAKYNTLTYTVAEIGNTSNVWSVILKSSLTIEPLTIVDFTNSANYDKIVPPGADRAVGTDTIGDITVPYFALNKVDYGTNDNWCTINYDQSAVDGTKDVWVKVGYRFGTDAYGSTANPTQQRNLHLEFLTGGWKNFKAFGDDNITHMANGWNEAVVKCPKGSAKTFYIGTFGIVGKTYIKYIAIFDNEADANAYHFGTPNATITNAGEAHFNNIEGFSSKRIVAAYDGDKLVKVVVSDENDEIALSDLENGSYTIKAFCWDNFSKLAPYFNAAEKEIAVN